MTPDAFWAKVDKSGDCWLWTGARSTTRSLSYGSVNVGGRRISAHRYVMLLEGHDIAGYDVMHMCDNPVCVRPDHLRLGTRADNNSDMWAKGRGVNPLTDRNAAKTHCDRGHEFDEANTRVWSDGKTLHRRCKECQREWARRRRAKRAAADGLHGDPCDCLICRAIAAQHADDCRPQPELQREADTPTEPKVMHNYEPPVGSVARCTGCGNVYVHRADGWLATDGPVLVDSWGNLARSFCGPVKVIYTPEEDK